MDNMQHFLSLFIFLKWMWIVLKRHKLNSKGINYTLHTNDSNADAFIIISEDFNLKEFSSCQL